MAMGQKLPVKPESGGKRADGYCTPRQDKQPQVMSVPPKRVLPIIFIPGMLGSNLRQTSARQTALKPDVAWRPADLAACARLATAPVSERQSNLDPAATEVASYDPVANPTATNSIRSDQGNAQVRIGDLDHQNWTADAPLLLDDLAVQLRLQENGASPNGKTKEQKALERGWGEISLGSDVTVLVTCESRLNSPFSSDGKVDGWWQENILNVDPLKWGAIPESKLVPLAETEFRSAMKGCWFPVHAMGYNWLESHAVSGKAIAKRIRKLKADYEANGFECRKVILVTHSMGGLVARAACHPKIGSLDNDGAVLGIVHGVMPALGAGAMYKRMRCGFAGGDSSPLRKVLGSTGREVTGVLANAQGGLELLPSKGYGNHWLQTQYQGRKLFRIPKKGDPYEEIYKVEEKWYRLLNPAWINPAGVPGKGLKQSLALLDQAKAFHETIADYYHERTFAHYGPETQQRAWQNVVWEIDAELLVRNVERSKLVSDNAVGQLEISDTEELDDLIAHRMQQTGQGQRAPSAKATLQSPAEPGEETVPWHSSDDQCRPNQLRGIFRQAGYEHEASCKDERALASTLYSIVRLAQEMQWENGVTSNAGLSALQKPSPMTHTAPDHVRKVMGAAANPGEPLGNAPAGNASSVPAASGGARAERFLNQLQAAGISVGIASSGSISSPGRASNNQGFLDYANEMSLASLSSDTPVYAAEQAAIQAGQTADAFLLDNPEATDQQLLDAYLSCFNCQYNATMSGLISMSRSSYNADDRLVDYALAAGADFKNFFGINNGCTVMGSGAPSIAQNVLDWDTFRRTPGDQSDANSDGNSASGEEAGVHDDGQDPGNIGSNSTDVASTTDGANLASSVNGMSYVDPDTGAVSSRPSGEVSAGDTLPGGGMTADKSTANPATSSVDWTKHPDYIGTTPDGTQLFVDHNAPVVGTPNAVQPSNIVLGKGNPFAPEGSRISYYGGTPVFSTPSDPNTYYGFGNNVDKVNEYLAAQQNSAATATALQAAGQEVARVISELADWQTTHGGSDAGASFGDSPVPESGSKTVAQIATHNKDAVDTATDPDGWGALGKGTLNVLSATVAAVTATTGPDGRIINPSLTDEERTKATNTALAALDVINNVANLDFATIISLPGGTSVKPNLKSVDVAETLENKLAPNSTTVDLASLRTTYAAEIDSASTFKTAGLDRAAADRYFATSNGQKLLNELSAADPGADASTIYARAMDQVSSGTTAPTMQSVNSPLVKIVPQGQTVTPYSPYFTTTDALQAASKSGSSLADYFGLPIKSEATVYDIYQINPTNSANVFVSKVAPTSELGGLVSRPGGATQYIVPNRRQWSTPTLVGTIEN